jgi:hypothetical protein
MNVQTSPWVVGLAVIGAVALVAVLVMAAESVSEAESSAPTKPKPESYAKSIFRECTAAVCGGAAYAAVSKALG